MKPSEALKRIFQCQLTIKSQPYNTVENSQRLEEAYNDFDEAVRISLLDLIAHSDDENHHENLISNWMNDPEYKIKLHEFDHIFDKSNKGEKE